MKIKITADILQLGFNCITTDNDVAFMRRYEQLDRLVSCVDMVNSVP